MTIISRTMLVGLVLLALAALATGDLLIGQVASERRFIEEEHRAKDTNEDAKMNEAVESLIDLMFKERRVRDAFERYFLFSSLSPEKARVIGAVGLSYSKEYTALDARTAARVFAKGWNYEYQRVVLALATKPLSEFDEALEESGSQIDAERKRTLKRRGLTEAEFYALNDWENAKDQKTLESKLATLELINADIDRFIAQRTNQAIQAQNLSEMKKSSSVRKVVKAGCTFYGVSIEPIFTIMFMPHNGTLKMVSFGDIL